MTSERKKLYLCAGINLILGVIIGIVLFYGQMKSDPQAFPAEYYYETSVGLIDVLKAWWMNLLWTVSLILSYGVLRMPCIHIIVAVRGCVSSFNVMYILHYIGLKETIVSVLPQCISILPLLICLSVFFAGKEKMAEYAEKGGFFIKRIQLGAVFITALIAAALETAAFKGLCLCLF